MGKRPLNDYFKAMLKAKRSNRKSFTYKGNKYVGHKHELLGMIYKKKAPTKTKRRSAKKRSADKKRKDKKIKKAMREAMQEEKKSLKDIEKAVKLLKEEQLGGFFFSK
tara:strand:- start:138 stop:461 length:324 start_codon:yes stop_codon:yes gene_type:complete